MKELVVREIIWYLAVQDGRWDDVDYEYERDAVEALHKLSDFDQKGICIQSRVIFHQSSIRDI